MKEKAIQILLQEFHRNIKLKPSIPHKKIHHYSGFFYQVNLKLIF